MTAIKDSYRLLPQNRISSENHAVTFTTFLLRMLPLPLSLRQSVAASH